MKKSPVKLYPTDQRIHDLCGPKISELRALLLAVPEDDRHSVLFWMGICDGCGRDLLEENGDIAICHCRNDE